MRAPRRCPLRFVGGVVVLAIWTVLVARGAAAFVTFESGQVRPLALSPDASRLFAVNTPDGTLEIFDVGPGGLTRAASVPVGMEPVAVAARTDTEVWVVNHLSDSVSIVDLGASPPRVVRTLLVGDEPRDIVFAGPQRRRAFITTARRGQNGPDPQLTTEGVGRASVWVFDALNLGAALGGTPLTILTLFGDTPRALAATPDGGTVYAAVFHSGNQTTALSEGLVCDSPAPCNVGGFAMPGGLPPPTTNFQGIPGPQTGLIVKFDRAAGQWRDRLGRSWNNAVRFSLPDLDVFRIDATAATPVENGSFAHVGTVLFNMVVNPVSGRVYVSNTEARNEVRFEGPGVFAGSTVRGHLHEARITVLDAGVVTPRRLNKHIDYAVVPSPAGVAAKSLATPVDMAVTSDGGTLYVAAFGSSRVGVFATAALENDTFVPDAAAHIVLSGGGPSGLVLDEGRGRLYVLTRFDDGISVVNTATRQEEAHLALHNPEPPHVVAGRPLLYDALATSSNGEAACAACHVFGDFDSLGWDLGNPDDVPLNNPNPGGGADFHPLKGPMTTQSLRGMANHGPMHWRGDRTGGNDPGGDPLDEHAAFTKFNAAFGGLLGRDGPIDDSAMGAFTDFILDVAYPPNPVRALDNSLTPDQQAARTLYFGPITDLISTCHGCHTLDPAAGFFGSSGTTTFEAEPQLFKVPHLRNAYQKVGMFGMAAVPFFKSGNNGNLGDQVRGFGYLHDGSTDTLFRFHAASVFNLSPAQQAQMEQFVLAFDTNLAPVVGQQITLTATNGATVGPRLALFLARAAAGDCDLVVKGTLDGLQRGWHRLPDGRFRSDRVAEAALADAALRAQAQGAGQERTYTCVPPGEGARVGVERDGDGFLDRDERDAGSDPADPASIPGGTTTSTVASSSTTTTTTGSTTSTTLLPSVVPIATRALVLRDDSTPPLEVDRRRRFRFESSSAGASPRIVPPAPAGEGDPTVGGAVLEVYNSDPAAGAPTDTVTVVLPPQKWRRLGTRSVKGWLFRDTAAGAPVRTVKLKGGAIAVQGGTSSFGYTLDEPAQGRVAVRLRLGTGVEWCADAPAKRSGNPPSTARNDRVDKFVAQPDTPAPGTCPAR